MHDCNAVRGSVVAYISSQYCEESQNGEQQSKVSQVWNTLWWIHVAHNYMTVQICIQYT